MVAYLWTAVLPCLNVIGELLVCPTGIAKVHNFVSGTEQPCFSVLFTGAGRTICICGRAAQDHLHMLSKPSTQTRPMRC